VTYYIDDLKPGMSESLTKTVTERDVELFGEVSGDKNPVHFDEQYAKGTIFKGRIAHGMLTASVISAAIACKLPGPGTIYLGQHLRFRARVRPGETVRATVTVMEILPEKRQVRLATECPVGGKVVIEGDALVMPTSKFAWPDKPAVAGACDA